MVNLEGFEKWDRQSAPKTDAPLVTVQQGGLFSLNAAAYEAIGSPEKVEIFFSREQQTVAFVPADPNSLTAYPARKQEPQKNYYVAGQKFTKYYKIDTTVARRYSVRAEDNVLFLDLNGPNTIATGVRVRPRSEDVESEPEAEQRPLPALTAVR